MDTQTVTQVAPEMVAEAKKKSMGMKRPKKLVKGSAAAKRWMAYVRSGKKGKRSTAKTPVRKTAGKRSVKKSTKKRVGRPRKTSGKKPVKKSTKKGPGRPRKSSGKKSTKKGRK